MWNPAGAHCLIIFSAADLELLQSAMEITEGFTITHSPSSFGRSSGTIFMKTCMLFFLHCGELCSEKSSWLHCPALSRPTERSGREENDPRGEDRHLLRPGGYSPPRTARHRTTMLLHCGVDHVLVHSLALNASLDVIFIDWVFCPLLAGLELLVQFGPGCSLLLRRPPAVRNGVQEPSALVIAAWLRPQTVESRVAGVRL